MNRTFWNVPLSFAACFALAVTAIAAPAATTNRSAERPLEAHRYNTQQRTSTAEHKDQKQSVTLAIGGAEDSQSAQLLTKALQQEGLRATVREQKNQPCELTTPLARNADLSAASKAVMNANTSQKASYPPSFDFVLFAPLTKDSAKQAMDKLRTLKGVDAQNSRANVGKGELWVRINGAARITPDDIHNAIQAAGIDAHFVKQHARSS
jgi:hypothetical protein